MSTTISKALYLTFEFLADVSLAVSQTKQKTEQRFFFIYLLSTSWFELPVRICTRNYNQQKEKLWPVIENTVIHNKNI